MNFWKIAGLLLIISVIVAACAPRKATAPESQVPPLSPAGDKLTAQPGWEKEWEKTLQAAKKEGRVSVYASLLGPLIREYSPAFKEKFGISLDITTGRGADMREKQLRERAGGIYIADVVISGLNTLFGAIKKEGATEPLPPHLILPEVLDPKSWYKGDVLPWADEDKHIFTFFAYPNRDMHINADFVKPGEIQSWRDLLDPKWKGKVIWSDPTVTGSGFNGFSTLILHKALDEDFYRQMVARQEIQLTRDLRLQVDWLARGKFYIAISAEGTPVAEYIRAGANLDVVAPKEGTYLSNDAGNISLVNRAPHPNAAKVFINWLLSKEGQTFIQGAVKYQTARVDIPPEGVNPLNTRRPGEKYFEGANSVEKWVLEEQDKYFRLARDIFGPLTGR